MGRICKYGKDRLEQRNVELRVDCPNCGTARITISSNGRGDIWDDVTCPKCNSRIILDSLSLTVLLSPSFVGKGGIQTDQPAQSR